MKHNTIKWRIFKYNLVVIILLVMLTTVIFNVAVRLYIEKDILGQLNKIAARTEDTALQKGLDFFPKPRETSPPQSGDMHLPLPPFDTQTNNKLFRYYFMLNRSLREPLSVLSADFILIGSDKNIINPFSEEYFGTSSDLFDEITGEMEKIKDLSHETYLNLNLSGTEYIAIVKPVSKKNTFGLGWIIIYSSLQKLNQMQWGINVMLFAILLLSAMVSVLYSSIVSKKISEPFSSLNHHIRAIAERNFGTKIHTPVYDELREFVNNINVMSEKLETHDKAQKTFLQNASHEFRTPLMSIQSYAEGIKYEVVDNSTAVDVIINESKRMTHLVEDLLYLSRLDAIEENYHFNNLDFSELIKSCVERMNGIAIKNNIKINITGTNDSIKINADEEKLSRAITNIISNCIRYATSTVEISSKIVEESRLQLSISDDGPGFEVSELPNIFERFFKGKKGNFGLGLAISKNVIERHNGKIIAVNSASGALFIVELPF